MSHPTLTIPTDCPGCKRQACGRPCDCGYLGRFGSLMYGYQRRKCDREHRYCDACGLCYEPVDEFDST